MGGPQRLRLVAGLAVALLSFAAAGRAAAQLKLTVSDQGAVTAEVGGVPVLTDLQVILPAPDWKGGAGPADCRREELGPGHTRVSGIFTDGQPCASFTLDVRQDASARGGADLAWQLTFTRDYSCEVVRLNGYLPCSGAAGKAAWFTYRPGAMKAGLFPAKFGQPGGYFEDWGFRWLGWLLPGGRGIKLEPGPGLQDMQMQDGREWGADYFQTCWVLAPKGTIPAGTVLSCRMRLEPLTAAEVLAASKSTGVALLTGDAKLAPAAAPAGGVKGEVELQNLKPAPQPLDVAWAITDDIGTRLASGKRHVEVAASSAASLPVAAPAAASGDWRLHAKATPVGVGKAVVVERRIVVPPGPRQYLDLDGTWELAPSDGKDAGPPPFGSGKPVTVPGRIESTPNVHWYLRRFKLPPAMVGKLLRLRFAAVNDEAEVFVNGHPAGTHLGGDLPFELDVTKLAHLGANDLAVRVTNWTALCTKPPAKLVVGRFQNAGWQIPPGTIIGPIGSDFQLTGIWQKVTLIASSPVYIDNVFVRTSVRRHTLQATVTLRNTTDALRTVELTGEVADKSGRAPVKLAPRRLTLAPGERRAVTLKAPWLHPHLWFLNDAHLYRLTTTLADRTGQARKVLDVVRTRFGFREVWTDGPRFVLNGVPVKLFATSGWGMDTWEAARAHIARMKADGTRAMRLHTQPWQPCILEAADELGMLIIDEAAVYCYAPSYAPKDPRLWVNYRRHVQALARRDRNHPALAIYSLENEILSCGGDPKLWSPHLGQLADAVRQVDPTRLITCESDLDPAGKMDLIGMHYPHEYWQGFTLYPDKCWWMDGPITYLGSPWEWKRNKPLYIGEFDGGFPAWYPQYQDFWLGNEAYASRGSFSAASPNSLARRQMIRMEVEAYRAYGVTGMNPWFDPDEVDLFGPKAYAPITLAFREKTHDFYAGGPLRRTIYVYNDSFAPARLELSWYLAGKGAKAQTGREALAMATCTATGRVLTLTAPKVAGTSRLTLAVALRRGGKLVVRREQYLRVFPRPGATAGAEAAPVPRLYLYDPAGTTARVLAERGLRARKVSDLASLPPVARAGGGRGPVLVIGARALKAGAAPWAEKLAQWVEAGGRVVCLEQDVYPSEWLPLDVRLDAKQATVIAFPRDLDGHVAAALPDAAGKAGRPGVTAHPALSLLRKEDLRFWQPDHLVARHLLLKPMRGNYLPLVDAGGIRAPIDDMNGLNWSPLLELPYGRGSYVLCQLLVAESADVEPAAGAVLADLVRDALQAPPTRWAGVGLIADPESKLKAALDGMGLQYTSLLGQEGGAAIDGSRLVIAGGGPAAWAAVGRDEAALRAWVQRGGVLWLNEAGPEQAALLTRLLGAKVEMRPAGTKPMILTKTDAVTGGLSDYDLYWRDRPVWDRQTDMRHIIDYAPEVADSAAEALTDPAGLVKVPVGRGYVLLNQIRWCSSPADQAKGFRIASILLTNLGARLDLSRLGPVRKASFAPVDLAPYCNLGFAGDTKAAGGVTVGWMGHGPDAMKGFPTGKVVLARVPFTVVDPARNGGRSVIALRGRERPGYPAAVTGIPVGMKALALHFLHACAWDGAAGTEVADYVVHYADGTQQRVPVRVGTGVADWYVDPEALPCAQVAWVGHIADKPGPIGAYEMRWVNPYPQKTIASLDVASADGEAVPILIAVTAEK